MHSSTLKGAQVFLPLATELLALGLCPVLLKPTTKEPVFHSFNRWQIGHYTSSDLQLPEDKRPLYYSPQVLETWAKEYPGANIGVLTREVPTVDIDNPDAFEIIRHLLPNTPHIKAGARGWSFLYRPSVADPVKRTRRFANGDLVHVEILADGRQTVLPPSVHPDTLKPYTWLEGCYPLGAGPGPEELTQTHVQEIELALRTAGLLTTRIVGTQAADDSPWVGNEDRYAKFFQTRLTDKFSIVSQAASGSRQQALNDAVLSCSSAVRVGALNVTELREAMHTACLNNGYIQTDGEKAFERQFWKALEEGYEISALPDLGARLLPSASAQEVFAHHPAPMVSGGAVGPSVPTTALTGAPTEEPPIIHLVSVSDLAKRAAPARLWTVTDWIPHRQVSLLYGEGGIGKTTLLMQMGIAISGGRPFMGLTTVRRKVLLVSAEDEAAELHYRIAEMSKALDIPEDGFHVLSLADLESALLWTPQQGLTGLFGVLCEIIQANGFEVVMLDPIADLFGGMDIDKQQVNRFMRLVRKRLCFDLGATVIIAAHPSSDGLRSGSGMAGSVAWSNSARSRMFFERVKGSDTVQLTLKKANRSALGKPITMRWVKGVFLKTDGQSEDGLAPAKVKAVFDELERRNFSYRKAHTSSEWVGIMMDDVLGIDRNDKAGKKQLVDLITRWERAGYIRFHEQTDRHKNKVPWIEYVKHPPEVA